MNDKEINQMAGRSRLLRRLDQQQEALRRRRRAAGSAWGRGGGIHTSSSGWCHSKGPRGIKLQYCGPRRYVLPGLVTPVRCCLEVIHVGDVREQTSSAVWPTSRATISSTVRLSSPISVSAPLCDKGPLLGGLIIPEVKGENAEHGLALSRSDHAIAIDERLVGFSFVRKRAVGPI
jgi:hypothetical protein